MFVITQEFLNKIGYEIISNDINKSFIKDGITCYPKSYEIKFKKTKENEKSLLKLLRNEREFKIDGIKTLYIDGVECDDECVVTLERAEIDLVSALNDLGFCITNIYRVGFKGDFYNFRISPTFDKKSDFDEISIFLNDLSNKICRHCDTVFIPENIEVMLIYPCNIVLKCNCKNIKIDCEV